ncbi:unnamed protein product [Linum tenue]|uniref:PH domain-containing protein n=1 Tax=Linum tenue TaxID=586396 RepID=A0AAV0RCG6_9ROSI|nr:unnamed protein product [Linum tenue]
MNPEERREWRKKIREVLAKHPDKELQFDAEEKKAKMEKLLADYPLVVDEEDPDWPEDADGWGFSLGQFFNKISIKNVKKDNDDDEKYDSDNEIVWQDDDYIRPIKDITTAEWEETLFKDISPLIVLVHNRYKRSVFFTHVMFAVYFIQVFQMTFLLWLKCLNVDAVVETDLVSALKVSEFPEIMFTKAGKVLYREKAIRTADEFSKIMAYFYYGAAKPPCLDKIGDCQEMITTVKVNDNQ